MAPRPEVRAYLARIGRKGGLKGGKARARSLSPARRSAIGKKAAAVAGRRRSARRRSRAA